ncbi:13605_t:CDS:2, partial [Acaulospora colombiana]
FNVAYGSRLSLDEEVDDRDQYSLVCTLCKMHQSLWSADFSSEGTWEKDSGPGAIAARPPIHASNASAVVLLVHSYLVCRNCNPSSECCNNQSDKPASQLGKCRVIVVGSIFSSPFYAFHLGCALETWEKLVRGEVKSKRKEYRLARRHLSIDRKQQPCTNQIEWSRRERQNEWDIFPLHEEKERPKSSGTPTDPLVVHTLRLYHEGRNGFIGLDTLSDEQ